MILEIARIKCIDLKIIDIDFKSKVGSYGWDLDFSWPIYNCDRKDRYYHVHVLNAIHVWMWVVSLICDLDIQQAKGDIKSRYTNPRSSTPVCDPVQESLPGNSWYDPSPHHVVMNMIIDNLCKSSKNNLNCFKKYRRDLHPAQNGENINNSKPSQTFHIW